MLDHPELETFNIIERGRLLAKLVQIQEEQVPMFVQKKLKSIAESKSSSVTGSNTLTSRKLSSDHSEEAKKTKDVK